jgi:hypothetical protein
MASKKTVKKAKTIGAKRAGGRPKAGEPTKSDFIREKLKAGMSASDIVKAAAAKGMKISPPLIYKLKTKLSGGNSTKPSATAGKTVAKDGKPSASGFIRQHPDKKAAEIVELAKAAGVKVTAGLVYTTRAYDKKKGGGAVPKRKPGPKPAPKYQTPKFQVFPGTGGGDETELKKAALAVGFPRALQVIQALAKKAEAVQRQYQALLG